MPFVLLPYIPSVNSTHFGNRPHGEPPALATEPLRVQPAVVGIFYQVFQSSDIQNNSQPESDGLQL